MHLWHFQDKQHLQSDLAAAYQQIGDLKRDLLAAKTQACVIRAMVKSWTNENTTSDDDAAVNEQCITSTTRPMMSNDNTLALELAQNQVQIVCGHNFKLHCSHSVVSNTSDE